MVGLPLTESWSQTDSAEFAAGALANTDAFTQAGSVRLAAGRTESFEGAASDWSDTLFSNGTAASYAKGSALGVLPSTTPQLPISADGDKEGEITGSAVYALAPQTPANMFTDCSITAYIYPRDLVTVNHAGLVLRATGSGASLKGYVVSLNYNSSAGTPVWIGVSKITNGSRTTLIPAGIGTSFDPLTEHFKVQMSITGGSIVARLWKVRIGGGVVTETLATTLSGSDSSYASGVCGLYVNQGAVFEDVVIDSGYAASGSITSSLIAPATLDRWSLLGYNTTLPAGTSLSVDILDPSGGLLAANVSPGTDLGTLPAVASQSAIKLRATLSSTLGSATPELHDWTVSYVPAAPFFFSDWSNIVSSTQDATPPVLSVDERTVMNPTAVVTGTAADDVSGVASVTVGGAGATTANGFATWSGNVAGLMDGPNAIEVIANDHAVPANTATVISTVYRITTPHGDPNNNGVESLLEHALGIPGGTANPRSLLPAATTQAEGGQRFLTLDFRRRIQRGGLQYLIETSENLSDWEAAGVNAVEQSVTSNGDGVTETVRVRITPAMTVENSKFVRLRVVIQ